MASGPLLGESVYVLLGVCACVHVLHSLCASAHVELPGAARERSPLLGWTFCVTLCVTLCVALRNVPCPL